MKAKIIPMEQHTLKNVNNCLNANIYSYLETFGGQSSNLYLNIAHFFNASVNWTLMAA
jgi:hypothetical protein